jgi:hypothetical protein
MRDPRWVACAPACTGFVTCSVLALGCANACGSEQAERTKPPTAEPNMSTQPAASPASLPLVAWSAFVPFAPDELDGFRALGAGSGRDFSLRAGARMSALTRKYDKGESTLELEMHDAVQIPDTRAMFVHARNNPQETPERVMRSASIQGHDALVQWGKSNQVARVSLLIGARFVVNVSVRPAASPDAALSVAHALDLTGIARLGPAAAPMP